MYFLVLPRKPCSVTASRPCNGPTIHQTRQLHSITASARHAVLVNQVLVISMLFVSLALATGSRAPSPRVPRLAVQASYARSVYQTGSRAPSPRAPRLAVQASDAQSAHRTRYNGLVIAFCFLASLYPQGAALHHRESSLGKQLAMLQYAACPAAH